MTKKVGVWKSTSHTPELLAAGAEFRSHLRWSGHRDLLPGW